MLYGVVKLKYLACKVLFVASVIAEVRSAVWRVLEGEFEVSLDVVDASSIDPAIAMVFVALKKGASRGGVFLDVRRVIERSLGRDRAEQVISRLPTTLRNRLLEVMGCLCNEVGPDCTLFDRRKYIYYYSLRNPLINGLVSENPLAALRTLATIINHCHEAKQRQ